MITDKNYHRNYRKVYKDKVKYVNVAIPVSMYEELEKLSEIENVKVSPLIRNMALAYMHQKTFVPKKIENKLKELTLLVRSIANNVNQMAHYSNTVKYMTEREEHGLLMELKRLEDTVKDYTLSQLKK